MTQKNNSTSAENANFSTDPIYFGQAMIDLYSKAQKALEKNIESEAYTNFFSSDIQKTFDPLNIAPLAQNIMQDFADNPGKYYDLNAQYWTQWIETFQDTTHRFLDEDYKIKNNNLSDRRFNFEGWEESAIFSFIKQSYLMTCSWVEQTIRNSEGISDSNKDKLAFTAKLYMDALAPSNFAHTNPEVVFETLRSGGQNLIKGLENLFEDIQRGGGELAIRTTDYQAFKVGENLATTKGSVIFENDLMQLIQYAPSTQTVFEKPLLIVPPWINKYYILDLKEKNSLVKWLVDQGYSVFMISWVNPDSAHADIDFEDYLSHGLVSALDTIEDATEHKSINAAGYCLGGTLLSCGLAHLKSKGLQDRIASATLLTTLLDFENAGDLKMFLSEEQIDTIEEQIEKAGGVFQAKHLQQTFKLLRANDMIWSFVVNNYLLGRDPFPFDLLYWNDDSTNMPAAMQRYYLRNMYLKNLLKEPNALTLCGTPIDLSTIDTPTYFVSAREDHIAPWQATYQGTQIFNGNNCFTLAASGHIAGVVNPPAKNKYCYWTCDKLPKNPDDWLNKAKQHDGSWWTHWHDWLSKRSGNQVQSQDPTKTIEAAPGRYVTKHA